MIVETARKRPGWALRPPVAAARHSGVEDNRPASRGLRTNRSLSQVARYAAVGVLNSGLDAGLYLVLTHWLGLGGVKLLAKGISYTAGTLNSFHWNRVWTFRSTASVAATLLPFLLASLAALGVNAAAMYTGVYLLHLQDLLALALATGTSLVWNFAASKFLVFRR